MVISGGLFVCLLARVIDIRVEGLETASHERISGVTNRVVRDHNGGVDGISSTAVASSAGKQI